VNSAAVEHNSTVHWKISMRSSKIDGSYQENSFFFLLPNTDIYNCVLPRKLTFFFCYQTLIYITAGEPHPQLHYLATSIPAHHLISNPVAESKFTSSFTVQQQNHNTGHGSACLIVRNKGPCLRFFYP
jgi:hypothetical protein